MHAGAKVQVHDQGDEKCMIIGLDEHGYLNLLKNNGEFFSVHPDGNSFDIMHNLITAKK